jgi:hypothetical protein
MKTVNQVCCANLKEGIEYASGFLWGLHPIAAGKTHGKLYKSAKICINTFLFK